LLFLEGNFKGYFRVFLGSFPTPQSHPKTAFLLAFYQIKQKKQ
jgi:hypothetical protein